MELSDIRDYIRALNRVSEGETVELQVLREGELITMEVQF